MYADRVDAAVKMSIKDRLYRNITTDSNRRRQIVVKRQRENDKWAHDLYEDNAPLVSGRKVGARDLRLKLQRKSLKKSAGCSLSGVRDLREKLSGIILHPVTVNPTKLNALARKSVAVKASEREIKKVANQAARKKTQQKADTSIDSFLTSLALEKYLITFQVEEVDMTALVHMKDEDLKAMGIPMGPRKKILLALESTT